MEKTKDCQIGILDFASIPAIGTNDFDWTGLDSDIARIREASKKFKELTITEAFSKAYKKRLKKVKHIADEIPQEVRIGSNLKVEVLSISKGNTVFDAGNLKDPLASTIDLWKFPTFKKFLPKGPIDVTVVDKRNGVLYVDPIRPLVEQFNSKIKNQDLQYSMNTDESVEIRDLKWVPGGFMGKIDVPQVSEFIGQPFLVDAFVPGSQIVLNIERNFEQWVGKSVRAFVTNIPSGNKGSRSIVCSVKKYLENKGNVFKINLFKSWTENGEMWKANEETTYTGNVTGVIHSSKKCGVFVELPEVNITGLVSTDPDKLADYHPGMEVSVKITSFDELKKYDPMVEQLKHIIPYVVDDAGIIRECNLKPVLEFA